MKIYTFLFLIILNFNNVHSQKHLLNITNLQPIVKDNKFPEIHYNKNLRVEEKINTSLQLEYLEHLPNVFKSNPFEKVMYDEKNCCSYVSFYEWKKNTTPKNILSIVINGEGSGAYPEEFECYNNFDLRTGNQILLTNIFTKKGKEEIAKTLNQKIKNSIQKFLYEIKDSIKNNNLDKDEKERIEEQITMYEDCIQNVDDNNLEYAEYYFEKDSLIFIRGRCSNHAMRAIDDLYTFKNSFSYKELEKDLSIYGKNLINGSSENKISVNPETKFYKGKINNKYAITATITNIDSDNVVEMYYWYDKVKIPIEWSGKFKNMHFSLTEYNQDFIKEMPLAIIEAQLIDNKIIGTWKNNETKEVLKLELEEY